MTWIETPEGSFYVSEDSENIDPTSLLPEPAENLAEDKKLKDIMPLSEQVTKVKVGKREFIGVAQEIYLSEDLIAGTICIKVVLKT